MAAKNHIALVGKTMRVLEALSAHSGGIGLADITGRAGLVKSSAFRILFTLCELGYSAKAPGNGNYAATPKLSDLGARAGAVPTLISIAQPRLEQTRDRVGESAWLAALCDGRMTLVTVADAVHPLRLALRVGDHCSWHASALGKVVAAHFPPRQLAESLGRGKLHAFTNRTVTSRRKLLAEFELIRRRGYAVNDQETIEGALAYGAPVFDASGAAAAAVSITAPKLRCDAAKSRMMIAEVVALAKLVTQDIARLGLRAESLAACVCKGSNGNGGSSKHEVAGC